MRLRSILDLFDRHDQAREAETRGTATLRDAAIEAARSTDGLVLR